MMDKIIEEQASKIQELAKGEENLKEKKKDPEPNSESPQEQQTHESRVKKLLDKIKTQKEPTDGRCDQTNSYWRAGLTQFSTEFDDLIKIIELKYQEPCKAFSVLQHTFEDNLWGKIIVGWELQSCHENEWGGSFHRDDPVIGTKHYKFTVKSEFWRGCDWRLKIWMVDEP